MNRPTIICLCGSTRFRKEFEQQNAKQTLAGKIVLSVGVLCHGEIGTGVTPEQKEALDELHKRKIDLADEVMILNVGGYIGESTRSELTYAIEHNKVVYFLEDIFERK